MPPQYHQKRREGLLINQFVRLKQKCHIADNSQYGSMNSLIYAKNVLPIVIKAHDLALLRCYFINRQSISKIYNTTKYLKLLVKYRYST